MGKSAGPSEAAAFQWATHGYSLSSSLPTLPVVPDQVAGVGTPRRQLNLSDGSGLGKALSRISLEEGQGAGSQNVLPFLGVKGASGSVGSCRRRGPGSSAA